LSETLEITCGGFEYYNSNRLYSAQWRETFLEQEAEENTTREDDNNLDTEITFD